MKSCAATFAGTVALLALMLFAAFSSAAPPLRVVAVFVAVALVIGGTVKLSGEDE